MIDETIHVIGLAGIGSWTVNLIAREGCKRLILHDPDVVERHNLVNQDYEDQHIGRPKAKVWEMRLYGIIAMHTALNRNNPMEIEAQVSRVDANSKLRGIVIVMVDSIEARREIFSAVKYNPAVPLLIDAGAAENKGQVRVLVPHDKDQVRVYEQLLDSYVPGEGPPACVSPHMGPVFAGIIMDALRRFAEGWRPQILQESRIWFSEEEGPHIVTEPVM